MQSIAKAPLPHSELNHHLKQVKSNLSPSSPICLTPINDTSLDVVASALAFSYLSSLNRDSSTSKSSWAPIIRSERSQLESRPELKLALQASLIDVENLIFQDQLAEALEGIIQSASSIALIGGQDHPQTLPQTSKVEAVFDNHPDQGHFQAASVKAFVEPSSCVASVVAIHFKQLLTAEQSASIPPPLATLLLSAILLSTRNLSPKHSSPIDEGAVGYLLPLSTIQKDPIPENRSTSFNSDDLEEEENYPSYDPFVPTFSDLKALYDSLRSSSMADSHANQHVAVPPASSFEWELIKGTQRKSSSNAPDIAKKTIKGDFESVLGSDTCKQLLRPIGQQLGKAVSNHTPLDLEGIDLAPHLPSSSQGRLEALCVGISSLHAFVQLNWTGPDFNLKPEDLLRGVSPDDFPPRKVDDDELGEGSQEKLISQTLSDSVLESLSSRGEPAYHLADSPFYLAFSQKVFKALSVAEKVDEKGFYKVDSLRPLESLPWWILRSSNVHSHVLDEAVPYGKDVLGPVETLLELLSSRSDRMKGKEEEEEGEQPESGSRRNNEWSELLARLTLEKGLALQITGYDKEASECFLQSAKINGLRYRLTGVLGKRTKYQQEDKTQLVLLAESRVPGVKEGEEEKEEGEEDKSESRQGEEEKGKAEEDPTYSGWQTAPDPSTQIAGMPSTLALNDDTLLEQTRFTSSSSNSGQAKSDEQNDPLSLSHLDPNSQPPLAILDQCTLLGLCLNIRNTQPSHGLTASQMSVFVSRVISHPLNWMVHTMSLLLRSRLESQRTRTVERSVLQLQALIDQMPTSDSTVEERLRYIHSLDVPPKWEMKAELAKRYASLGVIRSALEIFERIQLWEEVVQCLGALGRQEEGVEVIRDLLQGSKVEADVDVERRRRKRGASGKDEKTSIRLDRARQSKLWCLLGDLEPSRAEEHYLKAWSVSRESSARAARSVAGIAFAGEDHEKAARWLRNALRINPLYTRSWFVLGCCYMRLEKWEQAATSFKRCTHLDEEDGESWNNLASCYLRMGEESARRLEEEGEEDGVQVAALLQVDAPHRGQDDEVGSEGYSDREDSGVELSSDDGEDEEGHGRQVQHGSLSTRSRTTTPYSLKLLAHLALTKSLRYSYDSWRVWYNFMIVSVDVGILSDAVRAMVRVVEIRSRNSGLNESEREKFVDMKVLDRLVDAVTRAPSNEADAIEEDEEEEEKEGDGVGVGVSIASISQEDPQPTRPTTKRVVHNPNEGHGLYPYVRDLFDSTLLTRISSSPRIWRAYARLLLWRGEFRKALEAHLSAHRHGAGNNANDEIVNDKSIWKESISEIRETVEMMENLGPRIDSTLQPQDGVQEPGVVAMKDWKFQARSLVRTFMGRTKKSFGDEPEWQELVELLEELKNSS
ncbi:TPR-like protein [Violaceomyces palustris]|uniref:TPR-like protein n=1 Tax=Violaceomyces palustris TaxID=1673888 RepID=A0ACD0P1E3_9BASI|nr:TPR-like protein [Violaceomyces palustris]